MTVKRLFLDTEFNGHGGEFISIGIVSADGDEFYSVSGIPTNPHPWVQQNVIPVLNAFPVGIVNTKIALRTFLNQFSQIQIVADWPADLMHFFALLMDENPEKAYVRDMHTSMVRPPVRNPSLIPHNALSDAKALMEQFSK